MSVIISSMPSAGFRLMPPVSKQTPLPTKAIGWVDGSLAPFHCITTSWLSRTLPWPTPSSEPMPSFFISFSPSTSISRPRSPSFFTRRRVFLWIEDVGRLGDQVAGVEDRIGEAGERLEHLARGLGVGHGDLHRLHRRLLVRLFLGPVLVEPVGGELDAVGRVRRPLAPAPGMASKQHVAAGGLGRVVGVGAGALGRALVEGRTACLRRPPPPAPPACPSGAGRISDWPMAPGEPAGAQRPLQGAAHRLVQGLGGRGIFVVLEGEHGQGGGGAGLGVGGDKIDLHTSELPRSWAGHSPTPRVRKAEPGRGPSCSLATLGARLDDAASCGRCREERFP